MVENEIHEVKIGAGTHIDEAARELSEVAARMGTASAMFNDIRIEAQRGDSPAEIVTRWNATQEARAAAYRESPEGKAAEAARQEGRRGLQARHDALMDRLRTLDFESDVAVLDWLCEMQEPADHIGVISRTDTVIAKFEAAGFKASVNCGPDYRPGDRDNTFRYLVGQALDGFQRVGAPHSILLKFAAEWKAQFSA